MNISFVCKCGKQVTAPRAYGGKKGKRPHCGIVQTIPAAAQPVPLDPPTQRQKNYARKLGIDTKGMSKEEVSAAIGDAESRNPKLKRDREQAMAVQHERKHGPERISLERQLQALADSNKWIVAVYQSGKATKVDVMRVNGAALNDKGSLKLECEIAKVKKDRHLGPIVDLSRYAAIALSKIKWHEVIDEIEIEGVPVFEAAMERGRLALMSIG